MLTVINLPILCFITRKYQVEQEEQNMAVMQMVAVLVFVLCNCLAMVSNILEAFNFDAVPLTQVSNLLVTVNSSINIFIYCAFGQKYRLELKRLIANLFCSIARYNLSSNTSPSFKSILKGDPEPAAYYTRGNVTICVSVPLDTTINKTTPTIHTEPQDV